MWPTYISREREIFITELETCIMDHTHSISTKQCALPGHRLRDTYSQREWISGYMRTNLATDQDYGCVIHLDIARKHKWNTKDMLLKLLETEDMYGKHRTDDDLELDIEQSKSNMEDFIPENGIRRDLIKTMIDIIMSNKFMARKVLNYILFIFHIKHTMPRINDILHSEGDIAFGKEDENNYYYCHHMMQLEGPLGLMLTLASEEKHYQSWCFKPYFNMYEEFLYQQLMAIVTHIATRS